MKFAELNLLAIGNTIQMVGAIYRGDGKTLLCFFPEDQIMDEFPPEDLDMSQEEWQKFLRQTDLLETEVLTKASDGTFAKAILRKSQRQIEARASWAVFKRDGYACRYCGNDSTPLTVDHLLLWEDGGPSIEANLVACCKKCNKIRGNLKFSDWLQHQYYKDISKKLSPETRAANEALLATLSKIPIHVHARSR
jgi:hypothetical protein